jgi:hypothetical protein
MCVPAYVEVLMKNAKSLLFFDLNLERKKNGERRRRQRIFMSAMAGVGVGYQVGDCKGQSVVSTGGNDSLDSRTLPRCSPLSVVLLDGCRND